MPAKQRKLRALTQIALSGYGLDFNKVLSGGELIRLYKVRM